MLLRQLPRGTFARRVSTSPSSSIHHHIISHRGFCAATTPLLATPGKVQVRLRTADGTTYERSYPEGDLLMECMRDDPTLPVDAAGACSGTCQCSTCHVIMRSPEWYKVTEKLFPVSEAEQDCLDQAPGVTETSRLGCQITLSEDLDGVELDLPLSTVDVRWQAAYRRSVKKS